MHSFRLLFAGAAGLAIVGYWYYTRDAEAPDDTRFQTQAASIGRIESLVNTAGTISPVVTVEVGSELSGLVSELFADFNSEVSSGQVIARIDDRTVKARLRQTEADVTAARASLEQQQANLSRARADLELARIETNRQRELIARQLVSQSDVDRAEADLKIAEAQLEVAQAQLTAARATVLQREAQLEQSELDLERTYIRSPVDGTVIDRQVDVGQTVAASLSAPTLFQIAQDLTKMQIEADVDEADIGQVREGLSARFTVDAYPDRTFNGVVTQVRKAATVTSNVVTYKVIVAADNPDQNLLPGMTANVNIVLGEKDGVLRVNSSALRFSPPGTETAQGPGGFGGGFPGGFPGGGDRLDSLAEELELTREQRAAVGTAMEQLQASLAASRDEQLPGPPGLGGPPANQRERFAQMRQRMTNQLTGVLSAEQLARFESSFGGPPGGGPPGAGGPGGEGMQPGQIWLLVDSQPRRVPVLVGLSDSQFTEIRSEQVKEGDAVIVRLAR